MLRRLAGLAGSLLVLAIAIIALRSVSVAAQGQRGMADLKRWGDPEELAKKNAGKTATLTFAIDGEKIGDVTIVFYAEDAPNTVENFIQLAAKDYYDGLIFHRVIPGFMIQGGDPQGTGTGGPGWHIPAEFNGRKHTPGTVAMARSQHPDSAGSQFYICLGAPAHLDGNYTVFGQVISGQEHVDRFGAEPTGPGDRPRKTLSMTDVVISD